MNGIVDQVVSSALWAAVGDALGFITELASGEGLVKRRSGVSRVVTTIPWRRKIGGKFGTEIELPAGAYSDDTQLRLATGRAIRGDARFDVEAFAKIELPVFLSYALGAGRGTKSAASNLIRSDTSWFSNFFDGRRSSYLQAGGNGAAMRIQPHIWSAPNFTMTDEVICDIISNAVCTHGHVRGIAGAYIHAYCLSVALRAGTIPEPEVWNNAIEGLGNIGRLIRADDHLGAIWLATWEQYNTVSFDDALQSVQRECRDDVSRILSQREGSPRDKYVSAVDIIGGREAQSMGSGTKCAILASYAAWLFRDEPPMEALTTIANLLSSDTDTIATLAGAILGAVTSSPTHEDIQDRDYITREAQRMATLSTGQPTETFGYPDLLYWKPPAHLVDSIGLMDGQVTVAGLGTARQSGSLFSARSQGIAWQWLQLDFGQTIAAKRRMELQPLRREQWPAKALPPKAKPSQHSHERRDRSPGAEQQSLPFDTHLPDQQMQKMDRSFDVLDRLTDDVIRSNFDPALIGRHLLWLAEQSHGIELSVAYAAIVAKARSARLRKGQ